MPKNPDDEEFRLEKLVTAAEISDKKAREDASQAKQHLGITLCNCMALGSGPA